MGHLPLCLYMARLPKLRALRSLALNGWEDNDAQALSQDGAALSSKSQDCPECPTASTDIVRRHPTTRTAPLNIHPALNVHLRPGDGKTRRQAHARRYDLARTN